MADAGRVVCARCGANNFNTQAACWKCGVALSGAASVAPASPAPSPVASPMAPPPSVGPSAGSASAGVRLGTVPQPPVSAPVAPYPAPHLTGVTSVDPALAVWMGVALAFFFPSVAVPVGMVFLMLDDRRKAEIGRITLIWGIIFFLLHMLVTWLMIQGTVMALRQMLPSISGSSRPPSISDKAEPLQLPGIPSATSPGQSTNPFSPSVPSGFPSQ